MVARHPERPHLRDYLASLIDEFVELRGDRKFADDQAIVGGLGRFRGQPVVVMGHEKGHDTTTRLKHNFGMARPEGYRKAVRLMDMAERFSLPVLTFVDTAGAYPGLGAEERGQAEAIARSTERCLTLDVPMVATIVGEGGSGGAIALAGANKVLILEHSIYSVISPRGRGLDPVARRRPGQGRRHPDAHHRPGPDQAGHRRPHHRRARRRRALRPRGRPEGRRRRAGGRAEGPVALDAAALKKQRSERFYAIGRVGLQ
jgi:acetyl-CoA carboxylase carboxyl transferase subunit alpha